MTMKQTVKNAVVLGIRELTVYAFSTENWSRPDDEVAGLMEMFAELIVSETPELSEEGVRMRFVGRRRGLSDRGCSSRWSGPRVRPRPTRG